MTNSFLIIALYTRLGITGPVLKGGLKFFFLLVEVGLAKRSVLCV